jgi:hypothetical protein
MFVFSRTNYKHHLKYTVMFQIIAVFCLVIVMFIFTSFAHKEQEDEWL